LAAATGSADGSCIGRIAERTRVLAKLLGSSCRRDFGVSWCQALDTL
jgi:hypothetical protein